MTSKSENGGKEYEMAESHSPVAEEESDTAVVDVSSVDEMLLQAGAELPSGDTVEDRPAVSPTHNQPIGMHLGNLRLVSLIGEGGMGRVYLAEHIALQTCYAVKVLHRTMEDAKVAAERFRREALACSQLRHPNLVFVTDFGINPDLGLYLVMEFLEGETLDAIIERGQLPLWRVFSIAVQLCDGLTAAHRIGVIHRDLKPENIFIVPHDEEVEQVKVVDFGIARFSAEQNLTAAGSAIGTPDYMAPEQILGNSSKLCPSTDIYALGGILFELVTGRAPFPGATAIEVLHKHMKAERPLLSEVRPDLAGTAFEELVRDMLAVEPDERPQDCPTLRRQLGEIYEQMEAGGFEDLHPPKGLARFPFMNSRSSMRAARPGRYADLLDPLTVGHDTALRWFVPWSQSIGADGEELPAHVVLMGAWGLIVRDLLDSEPNSHRFQQAAGLFVRIGTAVCKDEGELSGEGMVVLTRYMSELCTLSEGERLPDLADAFKPLLSHPKLKAWADVFGGGKSLKEILTMDVRDFFK